MHANSAADVPARLEALAGTAGLGREALHSQLASGLRVTVHLVRERGGGARRLAQVCLLSRGADGFVAAVPAWSWDGRAPRGSVGPAGPGLAALLAAG